MPRHLTPNARAQHVRGRHRGLLSDQHPLNPNVSFDGDARQLNLGSEREEVRQACRCIVANALWAHWQGDSRWVFYSRDNTYYAQVRAGVPTWFTRSAMVAAVTRLVGDGFLEERRTAPSPSARYRSHFRAAPKLIDALPADNISCLAWRHTPPVILRCRSDRRILNPTDVLEDADLVELQVVGQDVAAHNAFLSNYGVRFHDHVAELLPSGLVKLAHGFINPMLCQYYRVFNGDLRHGGRWYGPWWQGVPSAIRSHLLIDGKPTVELDFAACQLRLMFASLGLPDPLGGVVRDAHPAFDLYAIPGVARDDAKLALLIMINARGARAARGALAQRLIRQPTSRRLRQSAFILDAVAGRFPELKPLWYSELGLRLQRTDSDICADIQREMRALQLPVLSVHDGFITWVHAEARLRAIMEKAFQVRTTALTGLASCEACSWSSRGG